MERLSKELAATTTASGELSKLDPEQEAEQGIESVGMESTEDSGPECHSSIVQQKQGFFLPIFFFACQVRLRNARARHFPKPL